MRNKRLISFIIAALLLCGAALAEQRLSIVCTDFPCYDFARQTAGERADVTMLLKPGAEAHAYDPTPADILAIGGADLFVYIGGESDAWAENILSGLEGGDTPRTLRLMDCVDSLIEEEADGEDHGHDAPEYDEHIWTSPANAVKMISAIADAVSGIDPEHGADYAESAAAYIGQVEVIDADIRAIVDGAARKTLVFADRFPFLYFVRAYGLDYMAAFASCTTDTEPSAQTVMGLIQRVMEERIPAVYTIELSTQSIAKTIAEETGAEILTMQSLQTVSQADFDAGATYVSIMRENTEALRKGLN